ncbi:MAG: GNAT family N-acetyltransferase [Patescibacteria group bacterium]
MKIRHATKKDLKACEALGKIDEFKLPDGRFMKAQWLEAYLDPDYYLILEEEGKIIGFIAGEELRGNGMLLMFLVIDKKVRNRGLGSMLLEDFEKRIEKRGITWVLLYGPTFNKKTLDFYEKHGYAKGDTYHEFLKEL